jgi:hypothetical protein
MTPQERRKIERIERTLEDALSFIRELLHDSKSPPDKEYATEFDPNIALKGLRELDRASAEGRLGELKQHELGAVFVEAGGPSADKRKPKIWLIEQILWRIFDFDRGHEAIRSKGESES